MSRAARTVVAAAGLLLAVAGCGKEHSTAQDPVGSPTTSTSPAPGRYPTFQPTDYTYRLQTLCYCPLVGPTQVTVKDGKVTAATLATGPSRGKPAPAYMRKTINDIIAIANDPKSGSPKVVWPKGADAPTRVTVNPLQRATDASVTYTISDISVG